MAEEETRQYVRQQVHRSFSSLDELLPPLLCRENIFMFKNGSSLKPYQAVDVQRLHDREEGGHICGSPNNTGFVLAYDMGLGKTVVTIALVCKRPLRSNTDGVVPATLVVCPSVGIISHWASEVQKFAPHLKVLIYHGKDLSRDTKFIGGFDIVLATYNQICIQHRALLKFKELALRSGIREGNNFPIDPEYCPLFLLKFHRIVFDEAHVMRNPVRQTPAACWALRKNHGLCLSGTPAQNSLRDLYPLLKFLRVDYRGLHDLETFDRLITKPLKQGRIAEPTQLLQTVLPDAMIYRRKDDSLIKLPPKVDRTINLRLTRQESEFYDYVRQHMPFKSMWAKLIRLRQACDHPFLLTKAIHANEVEFTVGGTQDSEVPDEAQSAGDGNVTEPVLEADMNPLKIPEALEFARELLDPTYVSSKLAEVMEILHKIVDKREKTIVFGHSKVMLSLISDKLAEQEIESVVYDGDLNLQECEWALEKIRTDDQCLVLLMSIMAGGTGLNITACSHVILIEPWWNPFVEEQAIDRVHRIGQTKTVYIYRLVVDETIEENVVATQQDKLSSIGQVLNLCTVPGDKEVKGWVGDV
ncbi:hypothetical protein PLICRDRAFT_56026 [Plicaturopsis crispa FD-325 SS-3]|nr:hypothetical protein PLICRDRAFT_56026 [Plicaturopsis crispa FD-325 SS-3]